MAKRKLSKTEEFEIMKLVLDKFLWIGTLVMLYGGYISLTQSINEGWYYIAAGAALLILFVLFITKEFEQLR